MNDILKLLEKDSRLTPAQIAAMLGLTEEETARAIAKAEADNIILGYTTVVNWDLTDQTTTSALIEVRISPQRGEGFDRIAERIYQFEEVESVYLMSGAYDLAVMISGMTMKQVAEFVFARLAPLDGVTGTATHFIMKRYKDHHRVFEKQPEQEERPKFV